MRMRSRICGCSLAVMAASFLWLAAARADHLTLNDGTTLEGTIIPQGDNYWIKTLDGTTRLVPKTNVKSVGQARGTAAGGSLNLVSTQRRADAAESPVTAMATWQKFIDSGADAVEAATARTEIARLQKLADAGAERINGQWVSGDELKATKSKSEALVREGLDLIKHDKTLLAIKKLEEAGAVYPNSYPVNFLLGNISLLSHRADAALKYYDQCLKLQPDSGDTLNNMAMAYLEKGQYERCVLSFYKSAALHDSPLVVHNLNRALAALPKEVISAPQYKPAIQAAELLTSKYQTALTPMKEKGFFLIDVVTLGPGGPGAPEGANPGDPPGLIGSGTGFIISPDGLILTNRHVASLGSHLMVILENGQKKPATVVVIDKDLDLALIRIDPGGTLPALQFSKIDKPAEGAVCFAMGFPLISTIGSSIKITQGIVSGSGRAELGADVIIDAKISPGNSGGPLLDKYGHVIGVITLRSRSSDKEDSYGMAIGVSHLREFLAKNHVTPTLGSATGEALTAEAVAAKGKPATVCIMVSK